MDSQSKRSNSDGNPGSGPETSFWSSLAETVKDLVHDPKRMALYLFLFALMLSIVVRYDLPGEFWTLLGGLLTGGAQARKK